MGRRGRKRNRSNSTSCDDNNNNYEFSHFDEENDDSLERNYQMKREQNLHTSSTRGRTNKSTARRVESSVQSSSSNNGSGSHSKSDLKVMISSDPSAKPEKDSKEPLKKLKNKTSQLKHHKQQPSTRTKNDAIKNDSKDNETTTTTTETTGNKHKSDEIERLREKKRRKKERQQQKKKQASSTATKSHDEEQRWKEHEIQTLKTKKQQQQQKQRKKQESFTKPAERKFITTHRGVQYCDIIVGKGPFIQDRKKVRVSYKLRAKQHQTGKLLDSSSNFGFRMGKGEVIKGWEIGLLRMRQGGVRHLIVPPAAGYGNRNIGAGSGALLYFEITLLSC